MKKLVLSRRHVLRGSLGAFATASVGLPLLEAMVNGNGTALADGSPLPKQFVSFFIGNGFRLERFEPTTTGEAFALSEELAPLAGVEEYLKVVTGQQNWCYRQVTHHEGMTAWSGYNMTELSGLFSKFGGPSIDQVIAEYIDTTATPKPIIRSIQGGISRRWSTMDSGTTMFAVSHRGPNEALYPEFNPQKVWQTLFSEFEDKPDDSALRLSIVDAVREDAKKLQARLGKIDKERIEAHLDGLKQLEEKIQAAPPACEPPDLPTETNAENTAVEPMTSVTNAMADVICAAMACDVTRVASIFFLGGAADANFAEIGQQTAHHNNTHDGGAQDEVHQGVVYSMQRLADFCNKMKATVDVTGQNLLDSGVVLVGSDCSVGLSHSVARQPYLLIGKARDTLKGKYHYQAAPRQTDDVYSYNSAGNTSDTLLTVLKAFNPAATSVGDLTPANLQGWYGTNNPPSQAAPGSTTFLPDLTGPAFEG
jgi:hypothetical protein